MVEHNLHHYLRCCAGNVIVLSFVMFISDTIPSGLYHDNPSRVPSAKCRSFVGFLTQKPLSDEGVVVCSFLYLRSQLSASLSQPSASLSQPRKEKDDRYWIPCSGCTKHGVSHHHLSLSWLIGSHEFFVRSRHGL